jgi:hypothetical protein
LLACVAVACCAVSARADDVTRGVRDLPPEKNALLYCIGVIGVLTIGVLVIGFKGTRGSQ